MIYLDSAATTPMDPKVVEAMEPFLYSNFGNPSSHYHLGQVSRQAIEQSREIIASMLECKPHEIYFTSGGSESNTWAIKGLDSPYIKSHILSSTQEHHSVINAVKSRYNSTYSFINADKEGVVDYNELTSLLDSSSINNPILCSVQTVNNETGIIQPIKKMAVKCKDYGVVFHTDAVQAFGHMKLHVKDLNVDMLSASGHKIHGPKGIGFLYISDDIRPRMHPLINGGQQEDGIRGSTENVAAIVGLGVAASLAKESMSKNYIRTRNLAIYLLSLLYKIPGVHTNVNLSLTDYRHISIRLNGVRAEEMLALLDSVDVCVSSGSACSSDSNQPSHVLKSIGLSDDDANSTIRVSLNNDNTKEDVETFVTYLTYFLNILRNRT